MKAIVHTQYGSPDVLQLKEVEKPAPKDHEILIRVRATSVSYGDTMARNLKYMRHDFNMPSLFWWPARFEFGFNRPKRQILGAEFAGDIEAVGKAVTRFKPGDAVFGYVGASFGANAEYLCMAEDGLVVHKPTTMSYEEAATLPYGVLTALNVLRKVQIKPGDKVLINGASGSIGSAAVQLARYYGAEVTGVCSTLRMEFVKALGAQQVIDYTREDFTRNGETYDVILDILGKRSFAQVKPSLKPDGTFLLASFKTRQVLQMLWTRRMSRKKVVCALSSYRIEDMLFIGELAEAGRLTAIIDKRYPLEETAAAHRYVESGQRRASVVIQVQPAT